MVSKVSRVLSLLLICVMVSVLFSACGSKTAVNKTSDNTANQTNTEETNTTQPKGEPTVIKIGTHYVAGLDPTWKDEVTGEPVMTPEQVRAGEAAMQEVLDKLNVKIEFVQYPSDVREILLQTVLAGDPFADIVWLWNGCQGTILGQGILQSLDDYAGMFLDDEDAKWMLVDKMFGHYYLLNPILSFVKTWPLVYNINYIEAVDALKENGKTVYPTDLYNRGEWTWSKFEDYLSKINAYYSGKPSPIRPEVPIKAFQTDYRYTATQALHSIGVAVYGKNGLEIDTPEAKEAIAFIDELMNKGLMMSVRYSDDSTTPGWTWNGNDFGNGETVFTNMVPWLSASASNALAQRGESMGIVPFPRPDKLSADDPKYQQTATLADSCGILKGISKEKTELALKTFKLYFQSYYKNLAGSDKAMDYLQKNMKTEAMAEGFDILHEKVGQDNLKVFQLYSQTPINELSEPLAIISLWGEGIVGESIYGLNNSPKYDVAVEAEKNNIVDYLATIEKALKSDKPTDNIAPKIALIDSSTPLAFPVGTDPSKINWSEKFKATDNVDGDLDMAKATIDVSAVDFNKVGQYDNGFKAKIKDASGNEGSTNVTVFIYDPNNKKSPKLVIKSDYRKIALNEDVSKINWANDFIESATDSNGFDIKFSAKADVSKLDTTTPGKYPVEITVTDFAGNTAKASFEVTVEKAEEAK